MFENFSFWLLKTDTFLLGGDFDDWVDFLGLHTFINKIRHHLIMLDLLLGPVQSF